MTTNQALVLTFIIAVIASITGANIVNNTTFLILFLMSLIALARTSFRCTNFFNNNNNFLT